MGTTVKVDVVHPVKTKKLEKLTTVRHSDKQVVDKEASAALIKRLGIEFKLTVEEIAKHLGKPTSFVSDVVAGRQALTFEDIERLEEATDKPVSAMFADCLTAEKLSPEKRSAFESLRSSAVKFLKSAAEWGSFARKHA